MNTACYMLDVADDGMRPCSLTFPTGPARSVLHIEWLKYDG